MIDHIQLKTDLVCIVRQKWRRETKYFLLGWYNLLPNNTNLGLLSTTLIINPLQKFN